MSDEDIDLPPASSDSVVQNYLDTNWREAMRAARDGMNAIRRVWPELTQHLPETASNELESALHNLQSATHKLHKAGPKIIGQEEYDEFIEAQTYRQITI